MKTFSIYLITSKVILGTLCEYGLGMSLDAQQAGAWYNSALRDDHPDREGHMLAAGANLGMGRILFSEKQKDETKNHLSKAKAGGNESICREAEWLLYATVSIL